jgi:predicted Fe-Mo cluster-binding NifX family protein
VNIAITLKEKSGLDSPVSPIFGRCPYYMFIDPDTKEFTIKENPAVKESGGAGIKASQFMVDQKVTAVISGDVGPKAASVLLTEGISVYQHSGRTAVEELDAYLEHRLEKLFSSSTEAHTGLK